MNNETLKQIFTQPLLSWFDCFGRKDLPWQHPRTPYRVWVSEVMLQQTQVQTVIPYFNRFMHELPSIEDLAHAPEDTVLSLWSGLGYYSRARNLHQTAKIICNAHEGLFPKDKESLMSLPGIGPSTAAAILSQAFNYPTAILDGNVVRVLSRFFLIQGVSDKADVKRTLWAHAQNCMSLTRCAEYTQAIMDLGATCCTSKNPTCMRCPIQEGCGAFQTTQQHLYPHKKIKKPIPTHDEQFIVLYDAQGRIYLEKRPPTGLWGGLWCLPSIAENQCPKEYIQNTYNLIGGTVKPLTTLKHRFSHFQLNINALLIPVTPEKNCIKELSGTWFTQEILPTVGLAKPTGTILAKVWER